VTFISRGEAPPPPETPKHYCSPPSVDGYDIDEGPKYAASLDQGSWGPAAKWQCDDCKKIWHWWIMPQFGDDVVIGWGWLDAAKIRRETP
jgi:hypothetical protein